MENNKVSFDWLTFPIHSETHQQHIRVNQDLLSFRCNVPVLSSNTALLREQICSCTFTYRPLFAEHSIEFIDLTYWCPDKLIVVFRAYVRPWRYWPIFIDTHEVAPGGLSPISHTTNRYIKARTFRSIDLWAYTLRWHSII